MRLTLFDLDHTLLPIDSDYAWGVFTTTIGWTDPVDFNRRNDEFYAHYKAGTLDIHDYVRFATDAVRRQGALKAEAAHAEFMRSVIMPAIRPEALALVGSHQQAGDTVLIVTATNEFVTRPIATAFGVKELIAIELARDAQGEFTGEIAGTPSFREGKVDRVQAWLAARQLDWHSVETVFYSDSINDLPLLQAVRRPIAVNPDFRLATEAANSGWQVMHLHKLL